MPLVMTAEQLAVIARAARAAYPKECCGLLVGTGKRTIRVARLVPAPNLLAAESGDRFELDPRVRIATERDLRGTPHRIVGHWHSHPDGSVRPSVSDLAMAFEPDLIWVVAGVAAGPGGQGEVGGIRAFRLDRERRRAFAISLRLGRR